MVLKLFHNTDIGNLGSILTSGLIPAGSGSVQGWNSYYHETGVYFVHTKGISPRNRFLTNSAEIEDFCKSGLIGSVECVLYVELPVDLVKDILKLVPDEEEVKPSTFVPSREIFEYCINPDECDAPVYLGEVKPEYITTVYVPEYQEVKDFLEKNVKCLDKIQYVSLD